MAFSVVSKKLPSRRRPRTVATPATIFSAATVAVLWLLAYNKHVDQIGGGTTTVLDGRQPETLFQPKGSNPLATLINSLDTTNRCRDDDDPPHWFTYNATQYPCLCPDPTVPRERSGSTHKRWKAWHNQMVQRTHQISNPNHNNSTTTSSIDVVLLGDSILEHFRGTKALGKLALPELRQVFEAHFVKSHGATLEGEALGTGGDSTTELLWHWTHQLLPTTLQPRALVLLIGTNDLGLLQCSKTHVLAAILNLATLIKTEKPQSTLILHGLLPRNEFYKDQNFDLGPRWEQIQWINQHLQRYAVLQDDWYYIENTDIFVRPENSTMMYKKYLPDGLHPSLAGYQRWAPRLVQQIEEILAVKKRHG